MTIENKTEEGQINIEVEKIIGDIRHQILKNNEKNSGQLTALKVNGDYFSAEFYENLYQASVSQQQLHLQVTKTSTPLIGGLIDRLRTMLHQVILFYLNQILAEQARVNQLNSQLINELGIEIEKIGRQVAQQNQAGAPKAE